jgi:hypothetical protein
MPRYFSPRFFSTVTVASAAALLGGCFFNPDYGSGGFSCATGVCPEGYVCVVEGTANVCRRPGARADAVTGDRSPPRTDARVDRMAADRGRERSVDALIRRDSKPDARKPDGPVSPDIRPDACVPQPYFKDGDGDGYGNPLLKVVVCAQPAGYVPKGLDCDDTDGDAHPGQTAFFDQPSKGTKDFDFNCDKIEEQEHPLPVNCSPSGTGCVGDGWVGAAPGCGLTGTWAKCYKQSGMSGCSQSLGTLVQSCR